MGVIIKDVITMGVTITGNNLVKITEPKTIYFDLP